MRDRLALLTAVALLMLAALACNAFAGRTGPTLPPPPTTPAAATPATGGTAPALAPTATLPSEPPLDPAAGVIRVLVDLNVRNGPGVEYRRVGFMLQGDTAPVLGRDAASGWWRIQCPADADGSECWISGGSRYTRLEPGSTATTSP